MSASKKPENKLEQHKESPANNLTETLARALALFEDEDRLNRWLNKPVIALNGERPIDLLGSPAGLIRVNQILGRIEHGIYS